MDTHSVGCMHCGENVEGWQHFSISDTSGGELHIVVTCPSCKGWTAYCGEPTHGGTPQIHEFSQ